MFGNIFKNCDKSFLAYLYYYNYFLKPTMKKKLSYVVVLLKTSYMMFTFKKTEKLYFSLRKR